jgi:hypothetical protein
VEDVLPAEVREFALRSLDSVAQLEALLLMRREIESHWTIAELAKRLYVSHAEATAILQALNGRGLVSKVPAANILTYRYSPDSPVLEQMVNATADAYTKYLIPLTHLVHTKSVNSAQKFADAFRLKGKQ